MQDSARGYSVAKSFIEMLAGGGETDLADILQRSSLRGKRDRFAVTTESDESFKKLLGRIGNVQKAERGLEALKKKAEPAKRPGIIETLFDQETGIITAPARFITAVAADVFNLPVKDEEAQAALEQYNPLEAAFRSAKGEFAVTGGDIFKTNEDDSFLERLGKWSGALAFDIATDPINYVGGISAFSRKGLATMAVRDGEKMLPILLSVATKSKKGSVKVLDELFESHRAVKAARLGHEASKARLFPTGVPDAAVKSQTAGLQLGYLVGANFERYGRTGIRKGIADLLGDDTLAEEFMTRLATDMDSELGQLITGGLFLKQPFSGKPIARIAGGKGAGNAVTNALNEARFRLTASTPAQFLSRNFAGKYGVAWAEAKKSMLPGVDIGDIPKTSLLDYVAFKDGMSAMNRDVTRFSAMTNKFASVTQAARLASENVEEFDKNLSRYFLAPTLVPPAGASALEQDAADTAKFIRDQINQARDMLITEGIKVGDRGPNWVMLRFTDEYYEELLKKGGLKGPEEFRYTPGMERVAEVEFIPDWDVATKAGYQLPDAKQAVALSANTINERIGLSEAGNKVYEEDPVKIAMSYIQSAHKAITSRRLVKALEATGTILVLPDRVQQVLEAGNTAVFLSALNKLSPQVRAAAQQQVDDMKAKLDAMLDEDELAPVQEAVRQRLTETGAAVAAADTQVDQALQAVRAAREEVRRLTPTQAQIRSQLQAVADVDSRAVQQELARLRDNSKRRADRLANRAAAQEESYEFMARDLGLPGPEPETLTDEAARWYDLAVDADIDIRKTTAAMYDEIDTFDELTTDLASSREFRETVIRDTGSDIYQMYLAREQALEVQSAAVEAVQIARTERRAAVDALTQASSEINLLRTGVVRGVVNQYVQNRKAWFDIQARYRNVKKSNMSPDELYLYNQAKSRAAESRRLMEQVLAYSTRKTYKGAGNEYAKLVIQMAETLSVEQFKVAQVLTNLNDLDKLVISLKEVPLKMQTEVIGDIFETYRGIRDQVTKEQLDALEVAERKLMRSPNLKSKMVTKEKVETEVKRAIFLNEEFAKVGAGKSNVSMPVSMQDVYTSKGVRGVLEDMYKIHTEPNELQDFMSRVYDPLATVWRHSVTVGRGPAFVLNNTVGGHVNNYLGGVTIQDHKRSALMISEAIKSIRKTQRENPKALVSEILDKAEADLKAKFGNVRVRDKSLADLFAEFFERGGHFDTDTFFQNEQLRKGGLDVTLPTGLHGSVQARFTDEPVGKAESSYRRIIMSLLDNRVQRAFSDLSQSSEVYLRFAAFVSGYRRFANLNSAMDLTYMLHFNYADLSHAEQWVRRFVPFYTWSRNNIPLQIRAAFIQSDKVNKLYSASQEFEAAMDADGDAAWMDDYMPDWLITNQGFISYLKVGGNNIALFPKLPIMDVDKMFEVRYLGPFPFPVPRRSELAGMAGPAVKTPIEWMTNRNYQYGYEYESTGQKLLTTLKQTTPWATTIADILSVAGLNVEREKRMTNLFGLVFGTPYGATTIGEKQVSGAAYGRGIQLSKQLKEAAADAGVDYEWLREQLNTGISAKQLAYKIGAGQGDVEKVALRKRFESFTKKGNSKQDRQYNQILRDLQG